MISNALHRITATEESLTSTAAKLDSFLSTLSAKQHDYFFTGLPQALEYWFSQFFKQKLYIEDNILEASYSKLGVNELKRMVIAMSYLKKIYKVSLPGKVIYRLTGVKELPDSSVVKFESANQFRSLTSWTTNKTPVVVGRTVGKGPDIILEHKVKNEKIILFSNQSVSSLVNDVLNNFDYFKEKYFEDSHYVDRCHAYWQLMSEYLKRFYKEKEVAVFLPKSQSIECNWRPARKL